MFVINWFWNVLEYLKITSRSAKIVFLGLDNAGKTTMLGMLKNGRAYQSMPTRYANMEQLTIGNITFEAHDLGGHAQARRIWKNYFPLADAILFVVDAAKPSRFPEAKVELDSLLSLEELGQTPVLIMGNKIDDPRAISEPELRQHMGLQNLTTGKALEKVSADGLRPIELFMCTVKGRTGFETAFRWLSCQLD